MRKRLDARLARFPTASDSRRSLRWKSLRALPLSVKIALVFIALLFIVALAAPALEPYPPNELHVGDNLAPPSSDHLFGTDQIGRDVFSRVLGGARISMTIGLGSVAVALVLAIFLGAWSAVSKRWVDETIMRGLDVMLAFPGVIIAVGVAATLRPGVLTMIGVLAVIYLPQLSRVIRAGVLSEYQENYVDAARAAGSTKWRTLTRHIAINCAPPVLVFAATLVADAIVVEASLSFLGVGIAQPDPSWGNILADGRDQLFAGVWWIMFFPGLAIFLAVLALNVAAEGFADALAAPRRASDFAGSASDADAPAPAWAAASDDLRSREGRGEVLRVDGLSISFPTIYGDLPVVSNVSFDVGSSEIVSVVGESGCGKSLIGLTLMGLAPPTASIEGKAFLGDRELLSLTDRQRRPILGREMAMVYQDALSSLNPGMTVGRQLSQVCKGSGSRTPAELIDIVGLPTSMLKAYPSQISGGQRQRILLAMALAKSPRLLIADEPTTALDETIQAQVVELLVDIQKDLEFSILLITHDVALAKGIADRVLVMYAGQLVEAGDITSTIERPGHPYTAGLVEAVSSVERRDSRLAPIAGSVPSPAAFPTGCRFSDRCERARDICTSETPSRLLNSDGRFIACHFPLDQSSATGAGNDPEEASR